MSTPQSTSNDLTAAEAVPKLEELTLGAGDQAYDVEGYSASSDDYKLNEGELVRAFAYSVNLVSQENAINRMPIYTRSLLETLQEQVNLIKKEMPLPLSERTLNKIHVPGPEGNEHTIWDSRGTSRATAVRVHYFARVELNPEFQSQYGTQSKQIRLLRKYNASSTSSEEEEHYTFPYALDSFNRFLINDHRSLEKMNEYWSALCHTKELWFASASRRHLEDLFARLARTHDPVTKVVCFGLGAIDLSKSFYGSSYASSVQYMAIFSIISALQAEYSKTDPNRPRIKLLLQDPIYEISDHQLIKKLWPGAKEDLVFVSEPSGLLAIDAGTLVVSAFLPFEVPLVQIIADLFHGEPGSGPVMVMGDCMDIDGGKLLYSLGDRAAPHVARFLEKQYELQEDEYWDDVLEDELMEDVYGEGWKEKERPHWLNSMELWVRKVSR